MGQGRRLHPRRCAADAGRAFEAEGHDVGGADGLVGFKTRIAVGEWQEKAGEPPTCFPDKAMVGSFR